MEPPKEPHSLSLKVLRLSRPSLPLQYPLPPQAKSAQSIDPRAALCFPSGLDLDGDFSLSPTVSVGFLDANSPANGHLQLTLPPAFGSAYVGETFSCTLCVNNELPHGGDRTVTSVNIIAEMQTPSQVTIPLELHPDNSDATKAGLQAGATMQTVVRFDLREEGNHVLAISLSYSQNTISKLENSASSGRVRTFRKLYQFIARPCLSVRTKASDLQPLETEDQDSQKVTLSRYALEAQLENLTDGLITLEDLTFDASPPFESSSLNWDVPQPTGESSEPPTLACREVTQVAFFIREERRQRVTEATPRKELTKDGRTVLGILTIRWRSAMGDPGVLSTGWLTSKRR